MNAVVPVGERASLITKIAARYSVEPGKMLGTLKQTAFRLREGEVSNEQMMALLIVADQYRLNPFTKEIYAFPDKNNGVVPVVGVDGWARIINEHEKFDGIEFVDGPAGKDGLPDWIEAVIYRKDRAHPTRCREYMVECKRGTQPWQSHPRRMLRHKAMIQCARIAFSFVGIYDEDEAQRIVEATPATFDVEPTAAPATDPRSGVAKLKRISEQVAVAQTVEQNVAGPTTGEVTDAGSKPAGDTEPPPDEFEQLTADWLAVIDSAENADDLADAEKRAAISLATAPGTLRDRVTNAAAKKAASFGKKKGK